MSITQPSPLAGAPAAGATAEDLRSQPAVGVIGLLVASALCALLGVAIAPLNSLQILGSVTTFALPILIASALWWHGWPARGSSRAASGVINTLLIAGLAVVLTALAQVIVGRGDLAHLLSITPAGHPVGRPAFPSYPWTLPLAALIFLTMILLTFVCDRWPLRRLGSAGSGIAAITLSWIIGLAAYELLADWDAIVPAPAPTPLRPRHP